MPEPFTKLLEFVQENVASDPNLAVSEACRPYQYYDPPAQKNDLIQFLALFANAVNMEEKKAGGGPKKSHSERSDTIKAITQWVDAAPDPSPHFTGVGLLPFAYQLALRVRKPSLVEQNSSRLCATVAMLYAYAKEMPLQFAKFGMGLYTHGMGSFKTLVIDPSGPIKNGFAAQQAKANLREADYVMLVSVRQCGGVTNLGDLTNVKNETLSAGSVCAKLEAAGYTNVQDHTFIDAPWYLLKAAELALDQPTYHTKRPQPPTDPGSATEARENLGRARQDLALGRFVLMMGHGDITTAVRDGTRKFSQGSLNMATRTMHRHMTAVRKIEVLQDTVVLRIISWGGRHDGEIDLKDFLAHYEGFVSAAP